MSALRASAPPEPVPSTSPDLSAGESEPAVRVLIPGTDRTYENREVLRELGLRWDPPTHAWHGALTPRERSVLRERFGLAVRPVVSLESFPVIVETPPSPPKPPRGPSPSIRAEASTASARAAHDGSRTRAEARIVLKPGVVEVDELESLLTSDEGREFSWSDVTSGLPDDSREADERAAARHLRDLRGRVKAAMGLVSTTPGLAETLASDRRRAANFYFRLGISEVQLKRGVPVFEADTEMDYEISSTPIAPGDGIASPFR